MVYHLFMVIWGMVYYCFAHIIRVCLFFEPFQITQLAYIAVVSYDHGFALFCLKVWNMWNDRTRTRVMSIFAHVINNMPFDLPCWRGNQTTLGIPNQYWVLEVVLMVFKFKKIFGGSSSNCAVQMFKNISRRSRDGWRNTQVASWASSWWEQPIWALSSQITSPFIRGCWSENEKKEYVVRYHCPCKLLYLHHHNINMILIIEHQIT